MFQNNMPDVILSFHKKKSLSKILSKNILILESLSTDTECWAIPMENFTPAEAYVHF